MTLTAPIIYQQCGMRIRSVVPLDLPASSDAQWDVDVRLGDDIADADQLPPGEVIAEYIAGDHHWYTATTTASSYLLRFRECGEFEVSHDLTDVVVRRATSGRPELMPILLAGTVSAFLLTLGGATVLHASAVAVDGVALAFVGQSGRGKSTVAALMCLGGADLVTDDVLAVSSGPPVTCVGGATELRLRAAAAHLADEQPDRPSRTTADERRAFNPVCAPATPLPLAAIIVPSPSRTARDLHVRRLLPVDAMFTVMSFPRVHGWRLPEVLTNEFTTLSQIANNVPVYEVTIPWGPPFSREIASGLAALARHEPDQRE